jgi:7-methyl-GTP pyrophosphatase
MSPPLILASSSRYRRELLERLRIPFQTDAAGLDESRRPGEEPGQLVARLAREKALQVAGRHPNALVIGADQIAVCEDEILGKPGTAARNITQLQRASGHALTFLTAVCLLHSHERRREEHVDETVVRFRQLSEAEISRYVELERPYDCAGGFKCEGLGIALFERIKSNDPTALIGLPLIWVCGALRRAGVNLP